MSFWYDDLFDGFLVVMLIFGEFKIGLYLVFVVYSLVLVDDMRDFVCEIEKLFGEEEFLDVKVEEDVVEVDKVVIWMYEDNWFCWCGEWVVME